MAQKTRLRLSTTHLDKQGERMSLQALQTMRDQTNEQIIPMGVEHDPRIPPQGRVLYAEIVELKDGEYALEGVAEIFDEDYSNIEEVGDREILIREFKENEFKIIADRSFRSEEKQQVLKEISNLFGSTDSIEEEVKKAVEPISILSIGAGVVLGNILSGFLNKLGSDAYEALKKKVIEALAKEESEKLFTFGLIITDNDPQLNVQVVLSNPTESELEKFFNEGIKELDQTLPQHVQEGQGFKKIIYEYKKDNIVFKYGVLKSGIPVYPEK